MGGDHLQELHDTCQKCVRKINTPNLSSFPPSVLLPVPLSGRSRMNVRGRGVHWGKSMDISILRHKAGCRRAGSRSGGANGKKFHTTIINNNLLVWNRIKVPLSKGIFFLFCFAFDNWMRDNDCKGPREPLDTHYVQSSALPRKETGTNTKMTCIHLVLLLLKWL